MPPIRFFHYAVCAVALLATCATTKTVINVDGTASHAIPPLLYGLMFEDVNGGDGGLYAELLQNRAFQNVKPDTPQALYAWSTIHSSNINVIADPSPVSPALPNSLQLVIPKGTSGQVGFRNEGYYGIQVNSDWTYNASFYYRFPVASSFHGVATVALQSNAGDIYAFASVQINGSETIWKQVHVSLHPKSSPNSTENSFSVTLNGTSAASPSQTINFAMFSLFPPTFKDRENGLRVDLATTLYEMKPSFLRFPGGNNIGHNPESRWIWDKTVGSLVDRPGRLGDWGYINTDGLGLLEYLYMCEDLEMEPIMAVWAGYSLGRESVPQNSLAPYIQSAIDQINFVIGDPATNKYAALRASLGHPEPFTLNYVEIGNEDTFSNDTYIYRWKDFAGNLSATFPHIQFIATTHPFKPMLEPNPMYYPMYYDNHHYQSSNVFVENAFYYDGYERNGVFYMEGEYAATSSSPQNISGSQAEPGRLIYPTVQSSVGEAAYMIGFERNADIVFAAAYAPLLTNVGAKSQWTPNLIAFDASDVYPSTSYYVQQLFSTHRGTEYLHSTLPSRGGTLHWSVTRDAKLGVVYFKVVNYNAAPAPMTFNLPFDVAISGRTVVITGPENASYTPASHDAVLHTTSASNFSKIFDYTAPAWSVSALTASLS